MQTRRPILWLVPALLGLACAEPEPARNLVLVVVDGLRADRLSCYGYLDSTSPRLDALAEEGVRFESTVSNSSRTLPAMAALFVGDLPTRQSFDGELRKSMVSELQSAGIRTAAFVEGGFVSDHFGFDLGFDLYQDVSRADPGAGVEETFRGAAEWLRRNREERFFLVVQTDEPRTPYDRETHVGGLDSGSLDVPFASEDGRAIRRGELAFGKAERRWLGALYNGGVTAVDTQLGGLLDLLEEIGVRSETAIVVTGVHGEDLGGRDPEWPGTPSDRLYDEWLMVPLIIHDPTRTYPVDLVTSQARTIDVMHTVVELLGLPPVSSLLGTSLVPLMKEVDPVPRHRVAWAVSPRSEEYGHQRRFAVRSGTHKLIMTPRQKGRLQLELYDLASDPGERANRAQDDPVRRRQLFKTLVNVRDGLRRLGPARFDFEAEALPPAVAEKLDQLGY